MKHLVDSDRIIDWLLGRRDAIQLLAQLLPDGLAISVISLGEVYEGVYYGRDPAANERNLLRLLESFVLLDVTPGVARHYALLRGELRRQGLLIPDPDLLIASTALEHNLTLVTRNLRHFNRVPGLQIHPAQPMEQS
ncbi:MAG: type II toxin-antitoxin system VapC family toxin [Dehalococcoidia bacterium]